MNFFEIDCSLAINCRNYERVGSVFFNSQRGTRNSGHISRTNSEEKLIDDNDVDINYLKSLNPKEWKEQDHYAVLGLAALRFNATEEDIRRSYRRMVLQHHPDKRKANGEEIKTEDDFFTCITKAYDILGTPKTRRAYDSIDPEFDGALPSQQDIEDNFYESFNKYFELNSRWSVLKNVPSFGNDMSSREDVEQFYNFWYDFKSWREYSYLDEEDKEKGQDRDERRWIEKENKTARIKRKKEEMMRIRALVDLAYNNDKRILKFKNEEREKKLAAKRAKMDAVQAQKAEQERAFREAQLVKERAERAEQKRIEQIRIEKEQMKKSLKKEKKVLRDKAKECKYFVMNDEDMLKNMEGVEKLCELLNLIELQALNNKIDADGKVAFYIALQNVEAKIQADQEEMNKLLLKSEAKSIDVKEIEIWSNENLQLLIKAFNLFPAGTAQRWEIISSFINQHSTTSNINMTARDVLNKAKALQGSDFSKNALKSQANDAAFESFVKSKKDIQKCRDITKNNVDNLINCNSHGEENGKTLEIMNNVEPKCNKQLSASKLWTKEEQALLEQAIKTYPITTPDRWDRIAECLPNRSKKECIRRVKELVELVNSKREAQQTVK